MLFAARDAKVKCFIYAASSSTFGDHRDLAKVEDKIDKPPSHYAVTKFVNALYAKFFACTHGFKTIGIRYFKIFDRRQDPEGAYAAVIPKWIAAMIKNEPIYINGDGKTSRAFCYIDNTVQTNLPAATATNKEAANQVCNVAVGDRTSLNQLYFHLRDNLASNFPHLKDGDPIYRDFRAGDVRHSLADIGKARELIGYIIPSHRFNDCLKEAMDWYVGFLNHQAPVTETQ